MKRPADFCGAFYLDAPLSDYTSWRVGGCADYLAIPASEGELVSLLRQTPADVPVLFIGRGSNLLVRDGGVRGLVICLDGALETISEQADGLLEIEAGVACARAAHYATRQGLAGAEFLAGIPGTLGGALAMNAGAFGGETWSIVTEVRVVNRQGECQWRPPVDYRVSYRQVSGPADEWFLAARLQLVAEDQVSVQSRVRALMSRRSATQPVKFPTAGSVFRNPPQDHAARLIEVTGLKGFCFGDACVSEQHANFIVNRGAARAAEIERLIAHVIAEVESQQGVRLQPEVQVVGEAS
ncbi:MAG: UDP-N-acetylmuramate dehydrogenase [Gammaproteobacteria bacterium]|nr:UDP-N-acetylmuramate dehydrogenase [Gammaproteobacteria bacterium]